MKLVLLCSLLSSARAGFVCSDEDPTPLALDFGSGLLTTCSDLSSWNPGWPTFKMLCERTLEEIAADVSQGGLGYGIPDGFSPSHRVADTCGATCEAEVLNGRGNCRDPGCADGDPTPLQFNFAGTLLTDCSDLEAWDPGWGSVGALCSKSLEGIAADVATADILYLIPAGYEPSHLVADTCGPAAC